MSIRSFKAKIEVADNEGHIVAVAYLIPNDQPTSKEGQFTIVMQGDRQAMSDALSRIVIDAISP